ncbi:nitrate assimilation regulatory nirA [Fusarium acutatum]|uniref:Nitrate assimilation regulatory nirA n=1 Tax=Fusarium acutatum TaxID=78861 RepID=A0A8H4NG77_9HYPO|nr:nitrate assimilation regulatory nirA [Fusarium acutatum]
MEDRNRNQDMGRPRDGAQLRPLLPALPHNSSPTTSLPTQSDSSIPKRVKVSVACEACRKSKIKCDGGRPQCRICHAKHRRCVYAEPLNAVHKRKLEDLASSSAALDLFQAIQNRSEEEATDIFRRIRAGADPESIMRQVKEGDLLLQIRLVPEVRRRYDFPYALQMPSHLQSLPNPYLQSLIYEWTSKDSPSRTISTRQTVGRPQYLKPYHAATLVDTRIEQVVPSKWTSVSTDDPMMRDILRAYFQYEYIFFSFFHINCFLDDLLAGEGQSCSSLLVNAILATGCHCLHLIKDRAENWSPQTLSYKFLVEAKRLWELDTSKRGKLAKCQAGMVMNLLYNVSGLDKIGNSTYLPQSAALAKNLGIYETSTHIEDAKLRLSREYTGWCFHWWQSFVNYSFRTPVCFNEPPKIPLPDANQHPEWYGEIWVKYPQTPHLVPLMHAQLQRARFEFGVLVNMVSRKLFNPINGAVEEHRDSVILDIIARLKSWYAALPPSMAPQNIAFPSQLKQQYVYDPPGINFILHYHNIVVEMCRELSGEALSGSTSEALLLESEAYYETLLRLYYLRHSFEGADMMLAHLLTIFAMLTTKKLEASISVNTRQSNTETVEGDTTETSEESIHATRSSLVLAGKGLCDQGQNYYLPQTLFRLILSQLQSDDAKLVCRYAEVAEEDDAARRLRATLTKSLYPVNTTDLASKKSRVGMLVRKNLKPLELLGIKNPYGDSTKSKMPSTGGSGRVFFPVGPKAYIVNMRHSDTD